MTTIRLLDARRGLNLKCRELFNDEKIAEGIYRFLCDGIEECEDAEPERKKGRWNRISPAKIYECSVCGRQVMTDDIDVYAFCHGCGAHMEGAEDAGRNE